MPELERRASLRSNCSVNADANVKTTAPSALPVYGVSEYLAEYQVENKDMIAAREAAKSPAAKKLKTDKNATPGPVVVGAKSSKHTILLNDLHQALALPQPHFTFEGSGDSGWTAEVSFLGLDIAALQKIKTSDRFNSKQEAKEATSECAVGIVERLKEDGVITTPVKGKRKATQTPAELGSSSPNADQPLVENYIGQLLGRYSPQAPRGEEDDDDEEEEEEEEEENPY